MRIKLHIFYTCIQSFVRKAKGKKVLEDLGVDGTVILK
jgi:hypothetical protein